MKQKNKKHYFPLLIMVFLSAFTMTVDAQDEVPNYPVLQELEGGVLRCLQEGEDGSYYIACRGNYKDTLRFNGEATYVVFGEELELEIPPERIFKIVKFDKDDNIVAEKEMYVDTISDNRSQIDLDYIKFDGGSIIVECRFWAVSLNVGEDNFVIDNGERVGKRMLIALDSESLEYQNHFHVGDGWEAQNPQKWDVKDGFVYLMWTAKDYFTLNNDTIRFEHDFEQGLPYINLFKYDYINDTLVWNEVLFYGLTQTPWFTFPVFFGLDINEDDRIYISGGNYGYPQYFMGDTYNQYVNGQFENYLFVAGSVMVVGIDGELIDHYHMQDFNGFAFEVCIIDDYKYILIQGSGPNINYRGQVIDINTMYTGHSIVVLKVDENGDYVDHWRPVSDCNIIYNYMRKSTDNELILFGQYGAPDEGCSNTTAEGIPFANDDERNNSILTLDRNLEVIENRIFFGDSFHRTIPDDNDISSTAKYVSYNWTKMLEKSLVSNVDGEFINSISVDNILYPNPTTGFFTVKDSEGFTINKIEVYNMQGVLIVDLSTFKLGDYIDISTHQTGTYFVKLITNNKTIIKKIIKL